MPRRQVFFGWRVVGAAFVVAVFAWGWRARGAPRRAVRLGTEMLTGTNGRSAMVSNACIVRLPRSAILAQRSSSRASQARGHLLRSSKVAAAIATGREADNIKAVAASVAVAAPASIERKVIHARGV